MHSKERDVNQQMKRLTADQYIKQDRMGLNRFLIRSEDRRSSHT